MTTHQQTTGTMRAIRHDRYGPPATLQCGDTPVPTIGPGEVLVRVRAAGVNRGDGLAIEGIPYAARLSYGLTRPKHSVPGTDLAGTVVDVGPDVDGFEVGDEVVGWGTGAFAEYAAAPASTLVERPDRVAIEQAAATPTVGVTALQALRDIGRIERGHQVLVIGAAGGVGTFAVQIAKTFGAEVTGVCSSRDAGIVGSIGADHVVEVTLEGAGHLIFAGRCDASRRLIALADLGFCSDPSWDRDAAHAVVKHHAAAFLRAALMDDEEATTVVGDAPSLPAVRYRATGF